MAISLLLVSTFLAIKLPFLFSPEVITGWDTIGHYHLTQVYRNLFESFDSTGYDLGWYQGFPVFYFYPPFFYFLVTQVDFVLGLLSMDNSISLAFNIALFCILVTFSYAFLKLSYLVFDFMGHFERALCSLVGLLFYWSYHGDGLQGVGLIGFLNGTVVATLGHSIALLAVYCLESARRSKRSLFPIFLLLVGIEIYTHLLTAVFLYALLTIYFIFFWKSFSVREMIASYIIPVTLAFPVVIPYLEYVSFSGGISNVSLFPTFLSLIGKDYFTTGDVGLLHLVDYLFVGFGWLDCIFIGLLGLHILRLFRRKEKRPILQTLSFVAILFVYISVDNSLPYLFPNLGVHWYRTFDIAFSLLCILVSYSLHVFLLPRQQGKMNLILQLALVLALFYRFGNWDIVRHEEYLTMKIQNYQVEQAKDIERFLSTLPAGTLILPEIIRDKELFGSPHSLDFYIQKYGHRNALGLTVESSLTPILTNAYLRPEQPNIFVWGMDDATLNHLYQNYEGASQFSDYIERSGIEVVLTRTPALRDRLYNQANAFRPIFDNGSMAAFQVITPTPNAVVWKEKAMGFITASKLLDFPNGKGSFVMDANQVRLRLGSALPIVNLGRDFDSESLVGIEKIVSRLIVFNDQPGLLGSHMVLSMRMPNVPMILVNFERTTPANPNVSYLYTTLRVPIPKFNLNSEHVKVPVAQESSSTWNVSLSGLWENRLESECLPVTIQYSYFPVWRNSEGVTIFQTDLNHLYVCSSSSSLVLYFKNIFSKLLTVMLYVLTISVISVFLWNHRPNHN